MSLTEITPRKAEELLEKNGVLVDVREPTELLREQAPGSILLPLSQLGKTELKLDRKQRPIFICHSGNRTRTAATRLASQVKGPSYAVEGGLIAWKKAGLPVVTPRDPASNHARAVVQAITGIGVAGFVITGLALYNQNTPLAAIGAVATVAAMFARNPIAAALMRKKPSA